MRYYILFVVLISVVSLAKGNKFMEIKTQDEHFINVHKENYVFTLFYNPNRNSRSLKALNNALTSLGDSTFVNKHKIVLELIDTKKLPFFPKHYDLDAKNYAKFFISSQMVNFDNFDEKLDSWYKSSGSQDDLQSLVENYLVEKIENISKEITIMEDFRKRILDKKIIGLYTGSDNINFERYFKVVRKNIDFTFIHTFDKNLKQKIYEELGHRNVPSGDSFSIIRHSGVLNEFDTQMVVSTSNFELNSFYDFIEFERFDKLRDASQSNDIFNRMIYKNMPLVIFVRGDNQNSERFQSFKSAIKTLPKNLIYAYVDLKSPNVGPYHQMFISSSNIMTQDTLSIIWYNQLRKFTIMSHSKNYTKEGILDFINKVVNENARSWKFLRNHLYDFKDDAEESELVTQEL